jgi:transcriptional regulator with GAF, ATPase, and Fis domain
LRQRIGVDGKGGDVALLAEAFLQRFAAEEGVLLGPQHIAALAAYPWPGNVRELQNVMPRAVLFDGRNCRCARCPPCRLAGQRAA